MLTQCCCYKIVVQNYIFVYLTQDCQLVDSSFLKVWEFLRKPREGESCVNNDSRVRKIPGTVLFTPLRAANTFPYKVNKGNTNGKQCYHNELTLSCVYMRTDCVWWVSWAATNTLPFAKNKSVCALANAIAVVFKPSSQESRNRLAPRLEKWSKHVW